MRLLLLTIVTVTAFAANSVLNRLALEAGDTGPTAFAAIRLMTGALALTVMVMLRGGGLRIGTDGGIWGAATLAVYMIGFSFAYMTLDTGVGALILFGGVQVTMFLGAILLGERPPARRIAGTLVAFAGLVWLLWPGGAVTAPLGGAALMIAAALGWAGYSLIGRGVADPLAATAGNFVLAVVAGLAAWTVIPGPISPQGVVLATVSGVVTSGMGYALWYYLLARLKTTVAALSQLAAPVIATAGGVVFFGEDVGLKLVLASIVVLGGVAFGTWTPKARAA